MKTKKLTVMLLAAVFAISAAATEVPKMNVIVIDDSKTLVAAVTNPDVASEVSVIAEDGRIVYYKKSKAAAQFKSILDLSELTDGRYTVKLKTGKFYTQRQLELNQSKVKVIKIKPEPDPVFSYDGDMLKLSYLNLNQNDLSISVYNGNKLVFQSGLGDKLSIQRAFDVSKMVKGEFDFVLVGPNQTYSYKIIR